MPGQLKCRGCPATFTSLRSLSQHIGQCDGFLESVHTVCKKRKAKAETDREAKRLRDEAEILAAEEWHGIEWEEGEFAELMEGSAQCIEAYNAPSPSNPAVVSRAGRTRHAPRRLENMVPTSLSGLPTHIRPPAPPAAEPSRQEQVSSSEPSLDETPRAVYLTDVNAYGLYREYTTRPQHDPEEEKTLIDFLDPTAFPATVPSMAARVPSAFRPHETQDNSQPSIPASQSEPQVHPPSLADAPLVPSAPHNNVSELRLLNWQYTHSTTSNIAVNALVRDVIQGDGFSPSHFPHGFTIEGARSRFEDGAGDQRNDPFSARDGWKKTAIKLHIPKEGKRWPSEDHAPVFEVPDVLTRSLLDMFVATYESPAAMNYHWLPHKTFLRPAARHPRNSGSNVVNAEVPPSSSPTCESNTRLPTDIRVYTDIYDSDAMIQEDAAIRAEPRQPGDPPELEYAVGAILVWSDSTHLTNFGTASLWPIYGYSGNQSKYIRARPTAFSAQHLAFVPSLPDKFQDWYMKTYGEAPTAAVLTFVRRELFQAVWLLLLDLRFIQAYKHGHIVQCGDEITRRMFPRFFIYSMDYVEKILAACLKYFAKCPCPVCLVEKERLADMGMLVDYHRRKKVRIDSLDVQSRVTVARQWIFEEGMSFNSVYLKRILGPLSLTPTRNTFSAQLAGEGFNFYSMLVPDLLHEFELGVWKNTLAHLIRLLYAFGGDKVQVFNKRFRKMPTFGRSTIRRFVRNMADLKKLAARDYEDSLQCAIPVFDGLADDQEDDSIILDMLFDLNFWHESAKLRLQTDKTFNVHDAVTVYVGGSMRKFANVTCRKYVTHELPKESAARGRRNAARVGQVSASTTTATRKPKTFNVLNTFKYHSLPHYSSAMRNFGPSDVFTTQTGELEHRYLKRYYVRTNKQNHAAQIARHVFVASRLRKIIPKSKPEAQRPELTGNPAEHFSLASSERNYEDITAWVAKHLNDPAFQDFIPRLQDHLLARLRGDTYQGADPIHLSNERNSIRFLANRIYHHHTLRVNYTTYDMRRSQDVISPRSHADIMMLAHDEEEEEDPHPYWYARVIRIFHVNVYRHTAGTHTSQRFNVLWVRWFGIAPSAIPYSFASKRLPRVGFIPYDADGEAFGFLDPEVVIRGAHIMPLFRKGHTADLLPPSIVRDGQNIYEDPLHHNQDYEAYNVNMFVDRDIFMRYLGGGVGHMGVGTTIETAFDDEDIQWQDLDPEMIEILADEPDESELGASANVSSEGNGERAAGSALVSSEEDVARLVSDLREQGTSVLAAVRSGEGEAENIEDDSPEVNHATEDADGSESEDDGDAELGQDDGASGEEDEDEYGLEGYAPP